MRVDMMLPKMPRREDETGAVAILVAVSVVALLLITAFTVDFGLAYNSKRDLQNASDGAALAAARTYADDGLDCTTDKSLAITADAQSEADILRTSNYPASTQASISAACVGGAIEVRYASTADTPAILGGLAGATDYTTTREAAAQVVVANQVGSGLRPLALCSTTLVGQPVPGSSVLRIIGPTNGATPAETVDGCPEPSGNWYSANCPEDIGSNSEDDLQDSIEDGCQNLVQPVQSPSPPPSSPDGLLVECPGANPPTPSVPEDCLNANTGALTNKTAKAFDTLLGETITLPVFCGRTDCVPAALPLAGGNPSDYPIWRIYGVLVCGYHFGNQDGQSAAPECATAFKASEGADPTIPDNKENYMLLRLAEVVASGPVGPSGCSIGDPSCDFGVRGVLLTE